MQTSQDQVKPSQPSPPQPQTEEKQQLAPLPKQDALAEKQIENQTTPISGRAEDRVTVASDKVIFWALFRLIWGIQWGYSSRKCQNNGTAISAHR